MIEGKFLTTTYTDGYALAVFLCILYTTSMGVGVMWNMVIDWFIKKNFHM